MKPKEQEKISILKDEANIARSGQTAIPSNVGKATSEATLPRLSDKHLQFALAYIAHGNAARATREAGYKATNAHVQGHNLLRKPNIRAFIEAKGAGIAEELKITAERLTAEMAEIAFGNLINYITFDDQDQPIIDISRATPEQMAAVSEFHMETVLERIGTDPEGQPILQQVRRVRIKLHPKLPALVSLGKQLGLFQSKPNGVHQTGDILADLTEILKHKSAPPPVGIGTAPNQEIRGVGLREARAALRDKERTAGMDRPVVISPNRAEDKYELLDEPSASQESQCPCCGR